VSTVVSAVGAVVVAGGSGVRLGAGVPKAFVPVGGISMLVHAVQRVRQAGITQVVAVVPAELLDEADSQLGGSADVVAGGSTRQASVAAGLAALPASVTTVLVHDAARCLAPPELVRAVADAVLAGAVAVVPGLPVADTVKRVDDDGVVLETVDRSHLRAVQTPQGFRRDVLQRAHDASSHLSVTDDAGLVELIGEPVLVVPGHPDAFKVTTPHDLEQAQRHLLREDRRP
jgi:2-C-methyl-D-erythritol 4-phosphate cytidylyltransferase